MKNILHIRLNTAAPNFRRLTALLFLCLVLNSAYADTNCSAAFEYETYIQLGTEPGSVVFQNTSLGDFTFAQWDFGDGTGSQKTDKSVEHTYATEGTYTVSLMVWTSDESCYSKTETSVLISVGDTDCILTDCVFPGDANSDGFADLEDLLHIGMGHGAVGPSRPNPSVEWFGQPAPDWDQETNDGINYKHLDCDGNGIVSNEDINFVINNYSPMNLEANFLAEGPTARLLFAQDTVHIDEDSPETISLHAVLMLGDSESPVEDIYGLAVSLDYDSTVVTNQGVNVDYYDNSFLGGTGAVLPYAKNLRSIGQVDLAFSRLDGQNTSGYGRIALIEFVIIVDIIGGRHDSESIFEVPVGGIVAVGNDGHPISFAVESEASKVVFLSDKVTSLIDADKEQQVKVFPNPATTELNIDLGTSEGLRLDLYDALGRRVISEAMSGHQHQLSTGELTKGLYLLNIETNNGQTTRKVMIE
ncbi:MAG: T9SS type A sorting domain-containing protein [Bacteroidota bacterium]